MNLLRANFSSNIFSDTTIDVLQQAADRARARDQLAARRNARVPVGYQQRLVANPVFVSTAA